MRRPILTPIHVIHKRPLPMNPTQEERDAYLMKSWMHIPTDQLERYMAQTQEGIDILQGQIDYRKQIRMGSVDLDIRMKSLTREMELRKRVFELRKAPCH